MKTVFPEEPARDFNEWMGYIKSEIDKSNKIKDSILTKVAEKE